MSTADYLLELIGGTNSICTVPTSEDNLVNANVAMELPEIDSLERADSFVKLLPETTQAYLYKALYLNDMRIDKAESILRKK